MASADGPSAYDAPLQAADAKPAWDAALTKYVHVWLWSILTGAATSEAFSFLSFGGPKWGVLGLGLVAIAVIGGLAATGALLSLARFFVGYLLPVFFSNAEPGLEEKRQAGLRLKQSLNLIILALVAKLLLGIAELALSTVIGGLRY